MKILITGATGLIGNEIVRLCHEKGISVNYLTTNKGKIVSKETYQGFYWNPESEEIDLNCFEDVTAIINLAGASISKRWTTAYKKVVLHSRLNTLRTLKKGLAEIDASKITSFVSASAIGIYPNSLSNFYSEDEKNIDDSFLGEIVEAWEKEIDTLQSFNFKLAKIRIGLVMSGNGGALTEMARPIRFYAGAAFGKGNQWQSWIHISDLARQFLFAIENNLEGIYNGVAPNPVSNTKLVKEIAKVLDKPLFLPNIPKFVMQTVLGEMSYLLFASQRVSSKKIEEEGFIFNHPSINNALETIY
jgi:uncharacterized protein (TIGR01777 family)